MRPIFSKTFRIWCLTVIFLISGATAWGAFPDDDREDPDWYRCRKDEDCTMAIGICGSPMGLQRKYQNVFKSWVRQKKSKGDYKCLTYVDPVVPKRPLNRCVDGHCSVSESPKPLPTK